MVVFARHHLVWAYQEKTVAFSDSGFPYTEARVKKKTQIVQVFISFFLDVFIICTWQQHKLKVKSGVLQNVMFVHRKQC